jgi:hypothetical protein
MNFFKTFAIIGFFSVSLACAQENPPSTNASSPLAEELVSLLGSEKTFDAMKGRMISLMNAQKPPGISQDAWDRVSKQTRQTMESVFSAMSWDKMKPMIVSLYAETFSTQELQGLVDFYKTPVGQKWIEKQPQLQAQIMEKTQAMVKDVMPTLMKSATMPAPTGSSTPIQPLLPAGTNSHP